MIIAIDGTSGSGKSTVAKLLSESLNFELLNTGLIYRKITKECLNQNIKQNNEIKVVEIIQSISFDNLTQENLHTEIISQMVPLYANNDKVRNEVRKIQKSKAKIKNIVVEGRDIGTVVFPEAEIKLFIDANINERANRRMKQLGLTGNNEFKNIFENLEKRDNQDENRDHSPLKKALDAIIIDTSSKEVNEVVDLCNNIIQNCLTTAST